MKYFTIIFLLVTQTCKTTDNSNLVESFANKQDAKLQVVNCPEKGTCKVAILKNKTISLQKDNIGKVYPKIIDGENIVIMYTFKKENPQGYQDGNESETVHFEIKADTTKEILDTNLKDLNLVFGKNCFCRDIAGFYAVTKGSFLIKSSKNGKTELKLDFYVPKVGDRQYIKSIHLELN